MQPLLTRNEVRNDEQIQVGVVSHFPPQFMEFLSTIKVKSVLFLISHCIRENVTWHVKSHICHFLKCKEGWLELVFGGQLWLTTQLFANYNFFQKLKCILQHWKLCRPWKNQTSHVNVMFTRMLCLVKTWTPEHTHTQIMLPKELSVCNKFWTCDPPSLKQTSLWYVCVFLSTLKHTPLK